MEADDGLQFHKISMANHTGSFGTLKIHAGGISYKNKSDGKVVHVKKENLAKLAASAMGPLSSVLTVILSNGDSERYVGLKPEDVERVKSYCAETLQCTVDPEPTSAGGMHFGKAVVAGNVLKMLDTEGKLMFTIPIGDVSRVDHLTEQNLDLQFQTDEASSKTTLLTAMRLTVPPVAEPSAVDLEKVLKDGMGGRIAGDDVVTRLEKMRLFFPRGIFDIELCTKSMLLAGKGKEMRVIYKNIARMVLLPRENDFYLALQLTDPLRQGQTMYPFIVLQLNPDEEVTNLPINMVDWDAYHADWKVENDKKPEAKREKEAPLKPEMSGKFYDVLVRLLKALTKVRLTTPTKFVNSMGQRYIACNMKSADGFLFPLDSAFFCLHKPPMLTRFEDVKSVNFVRVSELDMARSFDMLINLKNGKKLELRQLLKAEVTPFLQFLQDKRVPVDNAAETLQAMEHGKMQVDPESGTDESFNGGDSGDEESSSSEDEDFHADDSDSGASSSGDSDGDDAEGGVASPKAAKKAASKKRKEKPMALDAEGQPPVKRHTLTLKKRVEEGGQPTADAAAAAADEKETNAAAVE